MTLEETLQLGLTETINRSLSKQFQCPQKCDYAGSRLAFFRGKSLIH